MGKFHYCSSEDELLWYLADEKTYHETFIAKEKLFGQKVAIREWIDSSCSGEVIGWNGVSTPINGDANWHKKVVPDGSIRLYFTDQQDETLFRLKWL